MFFKVDPSSAIPVYAQIVDQVKHAISSGLLRTEDRLPSIRDLAKELRVNPNTVVRAYRELEHETIVESRRGQGSFVASTQKMTSIEVRCGLLAKVIDHLLVEAYHLDIDDKVLLGLVQKCINSRDNQRAMKEAKAI